MGAVGEGKWERGEGRGERGGERELGDRIGTADTPVGEV